MSTHIGGQAVIEGVLMRNKNKIAIAVRKANSKIKIKKDKIKTPNKFWKIPFIRGMYSLYETLVIGIKALNYSANEALEEEDGKELSTWHLVLTLIVSVALALVIFKLLPLGIAQFLSKFNDVLKNNIVFNLIEGFFKALIFVLYILIISFWKDVRTLFQYHGAEHKTVNCYEAKGKLIPKNVKKYSTIHQRCGTSFIVYVILISIVVYSFIPNMAFGWKYLWRILLLPVIAGISYELLKLSGKFKDNKLLYFLSVPGMLIQKLTTAEPDNKQVEVAIKALKSTIS